MSDNYKPPEDLYEAMAALQYDEALESDDPRYVDSLNARGDDFKITNLYRQLCIDDRNPDHLLLPENLASKNYVFFCGHIGCGKSTELRRIAKKLHNSDLFFVVILDVLKEIDIHNINYADILLALAKRLFEDLKKENINVDNTPLKKLEDWFKETFESNEKTNIISSEIHTEAKATTGIPFFITLFGRLTAYIKNNSTYKQEIRNVLINRFSQFSDSFNRCILAAQGAIQKAGKGKKLLFVIDGTDRLRGNDSKLLFIEDVHQLTQINGHFIYCGPIHLLYDGNQIHRSFCPVTLPMVKLHDRYKQRLSLNYDTMREMLFRRLSKSCFKDLALADKLIEFSGGCPRELFRLIKYTFLMMTDGIFDEKSVQRAIEYLAVDYKRILDTSDYPLLASLDQTDQTNQEDINSDRIRHFLYNMIVLEYNNFWRETHPVIKLLPSYKNALKNLEKAVQNVIKPFAI